MMHFNSINTQFRACINFTHSENSKTFGKLQWHKTAFFLPILFENVFLSNKYLASENSKTFGKLQWHKIAFFLPILFENIFLSNKYLANENSKTFGKLQWHKIAFFLPIMLENIFLSNKYLASSGRDVRRHTCSSSFKISATFLYFNYNWMCRQMSSGSRAVTCRQKWWAYSNKRSSFTLRPHQQEQNEVTNNLHSNHLPRFLLIIHTFTPSGEDRTKLHRITCQMTLLDRDRKSFRKHV
jgi:hypothetical protein